MWTDNIPKAVIHHFAQTKNEIISSIFFVCTTYFIFHTLFIDRQMKASAGGSSRAKTLAGDHEELEFHLSDSTNSRCWADSRGSFQGSVHCVDLPSFLPSFSFKNKTRGAVDNACRCASVIIKSRRTCGPVTLIPTSSARRCRRSRFSTSGSVFSQ